MSIWYCSVFDSNDSNYIVHGLHHTLPSKKIACNYSQLQLDSWWRIPNISCARAAILGPRLGYQSNCNIYLDSDLYLALPALRGLQVCIAFCITIGRIVERTRHVQLLLCIRHRQSYQNQSSRDSLLLFAQIRTQDTAWWPGSLKDRLAEKSHTMVRRPWMYSLCLTCAASCFVKKGSLKILQVPHQLNLTLFNPPSLDSRLLNGSYFHPRHHISWPWR